MNKKAVMMLVAIIVVIALIGVTLTGVIGKMTNKVEHPIATIKIEGYDEDIVVELYPEYALNTVKNFIALSNNEFYDGLIFHRVEKDFVIQGGDQKGDGSGNPTLSAIDQTIAKDGAKDTEYSINGEFTKNGYHNSLKHSRGVISMARSSYSGEVLKEGYNSAGSQFFICLDNKTASSLDGLYAAFGKVISGMDTVDAISKVELKVDVDEKTGEKTPTTKPEKDVVISSIRVETNGVDYGMPETHEAFDYSSWYMKKYYGL